MTAVRNTKSLKNVKLLFHLEKTCIYDPKSRPANITTHNMHKFIYISEENSRNLYNKNFNPTIYLPRRYFFQPRWQLKIGVLQLLVRINLNKYKYLLLSALILFSIASQFNIILRFHNSKLTDRENTQNASPIDLARRQI